MPADTPRSGAEYQPPSFPLFQARFVDQDARATRWIHGWNGLIGTPAADVTLGAKAPGRRALVTSALWAWESDARISALMAANSLDEPSPLSSAERLVHVALRETEWTAATLVVDGHRATVMTGTFFTVQVAYSREDTACFAAAWRGDIAVDRVDRTTTSEYPVDPFTPHSTSELAAQPHG